MKQDKDPIVRYGDKYRRFRVQFWEYMSLPLLEAFATVAEAGDFGKINGFQGVGRTRDKEAYAFNWAKGQNLVIEKTEPREDAGYMMLQGRLDFETINRIRNFRLFHLRGNVR